ncbi:MULTISPECIES: hypothetical protein [unclassified Duganella]|uniref:hypothetical protein n=1 Tax=unclassified Duganella TaxID=2636909 RepID=UPI000885AE41|nr:MULTISPECIES: hypothetical protein [unclassified Duganella]SDF63251.1 hypothetical protein SAMN05216320_101818 [Duganella sp. OV458]SDI65197.1 hypothetical protein SAMN05428973_101597 [Duganella sp. OV510]
MRYPGFGFVALLMLSHASALAQQDEPVQSVAVAGTKDPDWKPYRNMVDGLDAFDKYHNLAPGAALRFVLQPQKSNLSLADLKLRIAGDNSNIDVPIAADATFSLPRDAAAFKDDADLQLNIRKGLYRWRPDIHTPGIPPDQRRLGDLRLECEVRWAVDKFDTSFLARTYLSTLGGACHSSRSRVFSTASKPVRSVTLIDGERREQLKPERLDAKDPVRYAPPIHDESWSDDTIVKFEF